MAPKTYPISITTQTGVETFQITSRMTGTELVTALRERLQVQDPQAFFNIQYEDNKNQTAFVKPKKKVLSHKLKKIPKGQNHQFVYYAQFFPESVKDEMRHDSLRRQLWLQLRKFIVSEECYCPPELCVLFAAQSMQALHGNYDAEQHKDGFLYAEKELPPRVLRQHHLTPEQWNDRIKNAWSSLNDTSQEQAVLDYLSIAQDLEQYGVTYFEVQNKKGTKLWLGVHNLGMDIYEYHNKVTPRLGFPWVEIRSIAFNEKKFIIRMSDPKVPEFHFFSPRFTQNKRILHLCVGNHQRYTERRTANTEYGMEDRADVEAKIRRTKEKLLAIRADLESVKDGTMVTKEDELVEQARAAGMDKFKTMKKAQSGDARRRIEEFEQLYDAEC